MIDLLTQGFVTLAVGDKKYYQLAENLLKSYKNITKSPLPFAIICDRENEFTAKFDRVVILDDPQKSYMDKLEMLNIAPFDKNIFIDADCLVYDDINSFWNYFPLKGVSCFGKALDITSVEGWFNIDDIGEYRTKVSFIPQMHGGIIFFNKDNTTKEIYSMSLTVAENYSNYRFKYFVKPADEPILALCMAVYGCYPIQLPKYEADQQFVFLPVAKRVEMNISRHFLRYTMDGNKWISHVKLLHWQNINTETPRYFYEIMRLKTQTNYLQKVFGEIWSFLYAVFYYTKKYIRRGICKMKRVLNKKL